MMAVDILPCSGCRTLAVEVNRERRERSNEVRVLEDRISRLRYAAAARIGMVVRTDTTDDDLIDRLTAPQGN